MPPLADANAHAAHTLELAQAGAHEAALAIARLLKISSARVGLVETVALDVLARRYGADVLVVGFTISGGLRGRFALVTPQNHAQAIACALVGPVGDGLSKQALGALMELGNIGASAYLNGIADLEQAVCVPSVPSCILDGPQAALNAVLGPSLLVTRVTAGPHELDLALSLP